MSLWTHKAWLGLNDDLEKADWREDPGLRTNLLPMSSGSMAERQNIGQFRQNASLDLRLASQHTNPRD